VNKLVTVRGIVTLYNGNPQMVLASPDQIKVVDQLPNSFIPSLPTYKVGSELTVATYNVENLFDGVDDPYFNDETTPEKPREELLRIAAILKEINADVVAFQEVESRGYLKRFLDVFVPELGYNEIVHFEGNDLRGIDVCLASRVPVGRVVSHRHIRFPGPMGERSHFNRDLLQVELVPENGDPFEVWIVHLKSNSGGREEAEPIRLAEAKQVHTILADRLRQNPDADLLICGDFNDTFDSATMKTIMGTDQGQSMLKPLFESIPVEKRVSYNMEPYREMIDFILVSPGMWKRYIPNSYVIRDGSKAESGSDHNPVYCRFQARRSAAHAAATLGVGR
jgi:endonuclease/exonuclease/phosphatase family metal-dependent hydrolase